MRACSRGPGGYVTDCLFCSIVVGDVSATMVGESSRAIAFRDTNPQAPTHVLVIPRDHHETVAALAAADPESLAEVIGLAAATASDAGIAATGYRLVFNTGADAGQEVFHVHAHLLGGRALGWPPG